MIVTAGYITGIRTLADKSINVTTTTQELTSQQAGDLFSLQGKYVKILFSEEAISNEAIDEVKGLELAAPVKNKKSQSSRLRDVFYRIWEKQGGTVLAGDFDEYYENQMEIIINHFKAKL